MEILNVCVVKYLKFALTLFDSSVVNTLLQRPTKLISFESNNNQNYCESLY